LARHWKYESPPTFFGQNDGISSPVIAENILYLSDANSHCVRSFSLNGQFLSRFGAHGCGDDEFDQPCALAWRRERLYVVDWGNDQIKLFSNGHFVESVGSIGLVSGKLCGPQGICFGAERMYVAERNNSRIQVFDCNSKHRSLFVIKDVTPFNVAMSPLGLLYMTSCSGCIVLFKGEKRVLTWGKKGTKHGEFSFPAGISITPDHLAYVCDHGNQRVQVFQESGAFVHQWTTRANEATFQPSGLTFGPEGELYVTGEGHIAVYL